MDNIHLKISLWILVTMVTNTRDLNFFYRSVSLAFRRKIIIQYKLSVLLNLDDLKYGFFNFYNQPTYIKTGWHLVGGAHEKFIGKTGVRK